MQEKLIIYLHANDLKNPSWATSTYTHRGEPEMLANIALEREVIVVVPAEDVSLMQAKLPKMQRQRMLQALPFALEEQLIADVETLHFAAGDYQEDSLPVAVVAHEKMKVWLALLNSWNITPDIIIPETFAIPHTENNYVVLRDIVVIRTGLFQGFSCDRNNFKELFPEASGKESYIDIEQMIRDMANSLENLTYINLLQGAYKIKKSKFPQLKLGWKVAAYLMASWIFLLFLYPSVSYFILQHRMNVIDDEIASIYQRHFPNATSVVAPKLRMQEKFQSLATQNGGSRPLFLMGLIGKSLTETPSVAIKNFNFQNNQLLLELTAASANDFSAFADNLARQGLNVKQQNANLLNDRITAILQIE